MSSKRKISEQTQVAEEEQWIYCGPTFARAGLSMYTVYRGSIPAHFDKHFERCPEMRRLFVQVDQLAVIQAAINTKGTSENVWYQKILDYIRRR